MIILSFTAVASKVEHCSFSLKYLIKERMILIITYLLLASFQPIEGHSLMKQFKFPGNIWPNYVYNSTSFNVKSKIVCAALCYAESPTCNAMHYMKDVNSCQLADLTNFDWRTFVGNHQVYGYLDLGIFLFLISMT